MAFIVNEPLVHTPSNVARRCLEFVERVLKLGNVNVDTAFGLALGIKEFESGNPDHKDMVRAAISALRRQQTVLVGLLGDVPQNLLAPIVNVNSEIGGLAYLEQPMRNLHWMNSDVYQLALGWAAHVLPSSGDAADALQVSEVLNDVIRLKVTVAKMNFPVAVREFVDQLLQELERGVVTANFDGKSSLARVYRNATAEIAGAAEQLRASESQLNEAQRDFLGQTAGRVHRVVELAAGEREALNYAPKLAPLLAAAGSRAANKHAKHLAASLNVDAPGWSEK